MSKALITETYLTNIADAIRAKLGVVNAYTPGQMATAIASIPTGGITPTGTKNITQNGTHDVTQYASANVNVQPNLQSKTVTQNGTVTPDQGYDGLSSVVVSVSGGGTPTELFDGELEQGGFSDNGKNVTDSYYNKRVRSKNFIPLTVGKMYLLKIEKNSSVSQTISKSISFYASADYTINRSSYINWNTDSIQSFVASNNYCRVLIQKGSNAEISVSDIDSVKIWEPTEPAT